MPGTAGSKYGIKDDGLPVTAKGKVMSKIETLSQYEKALYVLSFLMLIFAAVFILVLYDSCKPKKRYEEIATIAGQDTIPRATFAIINRDGRQKVKKVWNPVLQDSVVWKVWHNEIDAETLYVHTGMEEFDNLAKLQNDTLTFVRQRIAWDARVYINDDNSVVVCYLPSASDFGDPRNLKVKLANERWEVESALPVRIKLQDDYLENNGDSIAIGYVPPKKKSAPKKLHEYPKDVFEKSSAPKIDWQIEKEWSRVAQCSTVVKKYYETPDSNMTIYFENPDSLQKRFMFEIKS